MSVQHSTELIIFVTHVEAEDSYLKIWGQVDTNSATCVERMILPLAEQFARSQGCAGPQSASLHINALCCARFQNDGYYRARVINIRSDNMVVLQFIDYGNIEILPPQEVHLLENIAGSDSLQSFPPVAFEFTLMHVLPVNGVWENKIIESIKKTLCYNEYKILIHSVVGNHRFIKLWYNNEDFSELLVKRHMAVAATLQDMFRPKCAQPSQAPIYQQTNKRVMTNNCGPMVSAQSTIVSSASHCEVDSTHGYRQSVMPCCVVQQKYLAQSPVPEALVFKSRVLDVGSKHDVYVSFVEDGPQKFSVQVQSTSQVLSMLMRDINTHPIEPLQEPPLPGSVCLGRYTQDKVLCRAVVMSVMENKCKLYYVDFGHTEVLPYTDIFQLPPHYISPRVLSIRFTLSGVKELNVTDEMKEYFKKIVSGKSLVLHVRPPEGPPLVQYGDLYDNGKNIKDILRQTFSSPVTPTVISPIVYQEPQKLSKGIEEIAHVSFVESVKKFFVQLNNGIKTLESIMACLTEFCKTAPALNPIQIKTGQPCAALYDSQWYRAKILHVNGDSVKVLYVDYGNEETVPAMSLRFIHEDLVRKLQAQAIKCILDGYELLPYTDEVSNQFELLILEKRLHVRVVDLHSDGAMVDLYDPETMESIKTKLLGIISGKKNLTVTSDIQSFENEPPAKMHNPKGSPSDGKNKWQKKSQTESWQEPQNGAHEKNKTKTWKDELNEEKQHDNKSERSNFYHADTRNERLNRDNFANSRNMKDKWNTKSDSNEINSFNRGTKGGRGGRGGRVPGNVPKPNYSGASDKSWSDKDSDTSSRGSSRRGRGGANRGGYAKRDGFSGKAQGGKWGDKDYEGSAHRTAKTNSDSYHGNRSRERKGQGHRITQNKFNTSGSPYASEEPRKYNVIRIPSPTVTIGSTKNCEVVFTTSPTDFFLQVSPDYTALDAVMENIASIYENGGESMSQFEMQNGAYCIAQYAEDSKWYRAVIKSVEGNGATVQFVDYGNTETVKFQNIKTIQKEFLKLPMQAVHCKLLGVDDFNLDENEIKSFGDNVTGKSLEVEFLNEENGVYNVLLREVIDEAPAATFINETYSKGVDLMKAKEAAMNRKQHFGVSKQSIQTDYASPDAKWTTISHEIGTKQDMIITWFTNPNNFYCQTLTKESEFRSMMNEIQKIYVGREPVSYALQIGSPIIAIFSDDGALYRAEIIELNKSNGHLVQYIDFGNNAVVEPRKIYPVEKNLMQLPKQAVQCSLANIIPKNGFSWSKINTEAIDQCFNADKYECTFHDVKDNKYLISLVNNGTNVADVLVERNLASFATNQVDATVDESSATKTVAPYDVQRVDISLLGGQTIRVNVSSVESPSKFYIQLPSAAESENTIKIYMANKDPSVLALPGELSVMQNQAIECSLKNGTSSPEMNAKLKELVEGKEVIVHVEAVDNNRLIVKLFDPLGNKIRLSNDIDEKLCPICPMPVFTSTHKVLVSYADHSASIWLQRSAEYSLDTGLLQALQQYYSTSGNPVDPKSDLLCAAKGADGQWYRAKIIKCTDLGAYVNFIDYGNNEEVNFDSLMNLDPQFYTPHQLAINVSLSVTLNGTEAEQVNILQSHLLNKDLTGVFYNVNNKWIVELIHDGEKLSDKFRLLNSSMQQESVSSDQPQIHNMELGQKYDVYVSHVDSPSQFWLQRIEETANLAKRQEELQAQASTFSAIEGILDEGTLCVAVYSIDNLWYRAQVLDADEDITTVRFIDYGNTDVIDNKSENIREMPDSWKEIKEYAIKCRLDVIPVDSEDWNSATCEKFENLAASVDSVQASLIADSVPKRVDLFIDGKSVSENLVQEHLAIMVHTEEDLIDEIVDLELDPHSAFVSHVNSPSEFWVQEEKSVGDLEVMSDRFIVADMFPKVEEITENLLCVAKFPEDEQWYRARVVSHNDVGTQVIYIDYGNSAISTEIRAIPSDLANIPPLSRKCCLAMPEGVKEWSESACMEFIRLAADGATIFLLDVLEEEETSLVKLTFDGKSVANILAEFCERFPPIIEERLPPLGEENEPNVTISHINTPDEFWIQAESHITDLEVMSDRLYEASSFLPLSTFEPGTICVAKYPQDDRWYRAKILSQSGDGTEVLYIDYGNSAVTDEIRILPEDIINIPPLSKRCCLQKPSAIGSWSTEACEEFEQLAATGATMFQFEVLNTSDPACVKLSLNGKDIVDTLVHLCKDTSCDNFVIKKAEAEEAVESSAVDVNTESCVNQFSVENKTEDIKQCDLVEDGITTNIPPDTENKENVPDEGTEIKANNDSRENDSEVREAQDQENVPDEANNLSEEHAGTNSVLELTVDEIIQSMDRNATENADEEEIARMSASFTATDDEVRLCENEETEHDKQESTLEDNAKINYDKPSTNDNDINKQQPEELKMEKTEEVEETVISRATNEQTPKSMDDENDGEILKHNDGGTKEATQIEGTSEVSDTNTNDSLDEKLEKTEEVYEIVVKNISQNSTEETFTLNATDKEATVIESEKNISETEKNVSKTEKNVSKTEENISGIDKNVSETEKDVSKTEENISGIEKNTSESEKNVSRTEKNISETGKNISESENVSETEKNISESENVSETEKNVSEIEKDLSKTEENISGTEKSVSETGENISETEKNVSEIEKDVSKTENNTSGTVKENDNVEEPLKDVSEISK